MVVAGFQRDVEGRTLRPVAGLSQCMDLRVGTARRFVVSFADDLTRLHHHRPHHGVGTGPSPPDRRKAKGPSHDAFVEFHTLACNHRVQNGSPWTGAGGATRRETLLLRPIRNYVHPSNRPPSVDTGPGSPESMRGGSRVIPSAERKSKTRPLQLEEPPGHFRLQPPEAPGG